jgi:hypothetical protein
MQHHAKHKSQASSQSWHFQTKHVPALSTSVHQFADLPILIPPRYTPSSYVLRQGQLFCRSFLSTAFTSGISFSDEIFFCGMVVDGKAKRINYMLFYLDSLFFFFWNIFF